MSPQVLLFGGLWGGGGEVTLYFFFWGGGGEEGCLVFLIFFCFFLCVCEFYILVLNIHSLIYTIFFMFLGKV